MVPAMRRCLPLLIGIVLVAWPGIGPAGQWDFSPPLATTPFDDVDNATLQAEVTTQALAFLDNLQKYWGEAPDRLRTSVTGQIEQDEQDKVIYLRNISDHGVLEGYEFRQNSLVRGRYMLLQRPLHGLNEFIDFYTALKQTLTGVYGEPAQDRMVWDNDLYQPVPDYWGVAVMIGHLHYHATWETTEGTITLELTGDRHSKLLLDYRSHRDGADT